MRKTRRYIKKKSSNDASTSQDGQVFPSRRAPSFLSALLKFPLIWSDIAKRWLIKNCRGDHLRGKEEKTRRTKNSGLAYRLGISLFRFYGATGVYIMLVEADNRGFAIPKVFQLGHISPWTNQDHG